MTRAGHAAASFASIASIAALAVAAACTTGANGEVILPAAAGSLDEYTATVHPIMEARCGTLDCHGDPRRPLRLFAETGLRARDDLRGQPITGDELAADVRSLLAVDPGATPELSLLVQKPLAGGVAHVGLDIWSAIDDAQPACLIGWLDGRSADPDVVDACATADAEVALPPP